MTEDPPLQDTRCGAVFSDDRTFRYRLWRTWNVEKPSLAFIMLNPSTADETTLDPTCRRCRGYAEDWGYGELLVGNLFGLRSTDPDRLRDADVDDPIGPDNDDHLREIFEDADRVVAAWGHHGSLMDRGLEVAQVLDVDLYALGTTTEGHPVHPLYQPADIDPVRWDATTVEELDDET